MVGAGGDRHRGKTSRNADCTPGYYNFEGEFNRRQDGNYNGGFPVLHHMQRSAGAASTSCFLRPTETHAHRPEIAEIAGALDFDPDELHAKYLAERDSACARTASASTSR